MHAASLASCSLFKKKGSPVAENPNGGMRTIASNSKARFMAIISIFRSSPVLRKLIPLWIPRGLAVTKLPLIIDAGLGQASDATIAMELGCDGVLVNTAIAKAKKPFEMAVAFKNAVIAGRQSFLSGRIQKNLMGQPSSPKKGII